MKTVSSASNIKFIPSKIGALYTVSPIREGIENNNTKWQTEVLFIATREETFIYGVHEEPSFALSEFNDIKSKRLLSKCTWTRLGLSPLQSEYF
jgi:hypothetical protein